MFLYGFVVVQRLDIGIEKHIDKLGERLACQLHEQEMIVIGHKAISNHAYAIFSHISLHQFQQVSVIVFNEEDFRFPRAAIVDMIVLSPGEFGGSIWHEEYLEKNVPQG